MSDGSSGVGTKEVIDLRREVSDLRREVADLRRGQSQSGRVSEDADDAGPVLLTE